MVRISPSYQRVQSSDDCFDDNRDEKKLKIEKKIEKNISLSGKQKLVFGIAMLFSFFLGFIFNYDVKDQSNTRNNNNNTYNSIKKNIQQLNDQGKFYMKPDEFNFAQGEEVYVGPVINRPLSTGDNITRKRRYSKNGVICLQSKYGRLSNWEFASRGAINMAFILNRTYIMQPWISQFIDPVALSEFHVGSERYNFLDFDLVAPYDPEVCGPDKLGAGKKIHTLGLYTDVGDICKNRHDPCNLSDPKIQKALVEVTKNVKAFHQPAQFFFYNSEWGKHANYGVDLEARFYQYLWPYKEIQKKAEDFIERKFANKEFAVVHIRNLEKTCYHRQITHNHGEGKVMCNMEYNTFMEIMENVTGRKDLPVFVAFDGEDKSVIKEYQSHGAIFYDGECTTTSCPLVDFEIAARSNFFAGTVVSTASVTIDFLRMYRKTRDVGKYYPSVLSWSDTEEGKKYNQGSPIHNTELKPKKRKGI